jgi:hypothetical protein
MSTIDYNTDNYTITELLAILELDDPDTDQIIETTNKYINRFSPSGENQPAIMIFFQDIQTKLLQYMDELETTGKDAEYTPDSEQTENWIKNQVLPQNDNPVQKDKNTDRVQKIDVYDNTHVPMNREQLGVSNTFDVPVAQDTLNPNLENITSRFINLDSQFRQASGGSESMSTDYTLDLSDPLTNVLSLRLYSIQIPYTWYTIDYMYGNTCFWLTNPDSTGEINTFKIFIEPGNYSNASFCTAINNAFTTAANFKKPFSDVDWPTAFTHTAPVPDIATFNPNNGKITLRLEGWIDPASNPVKTIDQYNSDFNSNTDAYFTFFDINGTKNCYESGTYACSASGQLINSTLGWVMGFRLPIQPVFTSGNTPVSVLNLIGTKYFILVLDDYNQNHINNGLITITELSKTLPLPSYYNSSQPYACIPSVPLISNINTVGNLTNINGELATALGINPNNFFNSIQDKLDTGYGSIQQILPSAPRTLTQAQIYTINEIIKNRSKTTSFMAKAPTNSDTFALIPIKYGGMTTGQLYVETSGQFQDNKRIYFGPVNIDRLRIRLLDDRGNVIDLHGSDWSVTLISDNLYQY